MKILNFSESISQIWLKFCSYTYPDHLQHQHKYYVKKINYC